MISLVFVFEPYRISSRYEEGTFNSDSRNLFYIANDNGSYDLYFDGKYYITESEISDPQLPVYSSFPQ